MNERMETRREGRGGEGREGADTDLLWRWELWLSAEARTQALRD